MSKIFTSPTPFVTKKKKSHLTIQIVPKDGFSKWRKAQKDALLTKCDNIGFKGKNGQIVVEHDDKGKALSIFAGTENQTSYYAYADICQSIAKIFSDDFLKDTSFEIDAKDLDDDAMNAAHIGWGWACYKFDSYKESAPNPKPQLLWSKKADKQRVEAFVNSVNQLRNMINTPANDCGPEELEKFTDDMALHYDAKMKVISDKSLLEQNFELIYTVGKASPRAPRLIELNWGKESDPKVTLVGKGVAFDTGGLDIKPSQYMRHMKKDMGGAAHALNLAHMIMELKLPIRLRVLIAAVENSISGNAFRPGDIIKSRKGTFVENTNTDAEGRLILADTLTYACEDDPELIIDFATLTGSARAALGPDIPAFFSNNDKIASELQDGGFKCEDPIWRMPLWQDYRKHIKSAAGDIVNSAGLPGDLIYSALFLEGFLVNPPKKKKVPDWVHFDTHAWELSGRAGRPVGAADCGMRAMYAYLENTYAKKKAK